MIVYGGADTSTESKLTGGGRYDPGSNAWQPTAPWGPARMMHTAVWAASIGRMIVWGGCGGSGVGCTALNDGALYDPVTDAWTPMNSPSFPDARFDHTAVWTGSKMIIWGGALPGSVVLQSGAVYDPATDTWSPMATSGAPSARRYHTAIWTGSKMIVWGGASSGLAPLGDGGIYDPATNTWTRLSAGVVGAPSARYKHTAVWTGSEMIIWGGSGGGSPGTGAMFVP
jgi:N-acetylneuraminic acid mutarotase